MPSDAALEAARDAVNGWFEAEEPDNDRSYAAPPENYPELKAAVATALDAFAARDREERAKLVEGEEMWDGENGMVSIADVIRGHK